MCSKDEDEKEADQHLGVQVPSFPCPCSWAASVASCRSLWSQSFHTTFLYRLAEALLVVRAWAERLSSSCQKCLISENCPYLPYRSTTLQGGWYAWSQLLYRFKASSKFRLLREFVSFKCPTSLYKFHGSLVLKTTILDHGSLPSILRCCFKAIGSFQKLRIRLEGNVSAFINKVTKGGLMCIPCPVPHCKENILEFVDSSDGWMPW